MTPDLDELERLARRATPGPWEPSSTINHGKSRVTADNHKSTLIDCNNEADAAYIAAANPTVILALIKLVRSKKLPEAGARRSG